MSRPKLVIGNKNYSSWSLRAWLALAKLGVAFEEIRVALFTESYKQQLLQYSPAGKAPAARALARSIAAEMHAGFAALRSDMPMNCRAGRRRVAVSAAVAADIARVQSIWTTCRAAAVNDGPWLFGSFTLADAMYAPVVSRFHTYGVACNAAAADYMRTVLDDPCMRQWYEAGSRETEVIDEDEAGVVC
jgi:glutathione S-transferase